MNIYIYILLGLMACSPSPPMNERVDDRDVKKYKENPLESLKISLNIQKNHLNKLENDDKYRCCNYWIQECLADISKLISKVNDLEDSDIDSVNKYKEKLEIIKNNMQYYVYDFISLSIPEIMNISIFRQNIYRSTQSKSFKSFTRESKIVFFKKIQNFFSDENNNSKISLLEFEHLDVFQKLQDIVNNVKEIKKIEVNFGSHCVTIKDSINIKDKIKFNDLKQICLNDSCEGTVEVVLPGFIISIDTSPEKETVIKALVY